MIITDSDSLIYIINIPRPYFQLYPIAVLEAGTVFESITNIESSILTKTAAPQAANRSLLFVISL